MHRGVTSKKITGKGKAGYRRQEVRYLFALTKRGLQSQKGGRATVPSLTMSYIWQII